jgi:hypothetical protein
VRELTESLGTSSDIPRDAGHPCGAPGGCLMTKQMAGLRTIDGTAAKSLPEVGNGALVVSEAR